MSALALNPSSHRRPSNGLIGIGRCATRLALSIRSVRPLRLGRELEGALRAERQGLPIRINSYYLALADPRDPDCPYVANACPTDARRLKSPETSWTLSARSPTKSLRGSFSAIPTVFCCSSPTAARSIVDSVRGRAWWEVATGRRLSRSRAGARLDSCPFGDSGCHRERRGPVCDVHRAPGPRDRCRAIGAFRRNDPPRHARSRHTSDADHRRVTASLRKFHPLWVMTHFNHPKELTPRLWELATSSQTRGSP